jgi:hypothetical protein
MKPSTKKGLLLLGFGTIWGIELAMCYAAGYISHELAHLLGL